MKKLLIALAVLGALLLVAYFVVTSSGFLKSVVLPRVGQALNAKVDAESISLSPFSQVEIRRLSIVPNGAEPLATVDLARVRYRLFSVLAGNIVLDEILITTPVITLVQKPDGTSNLDPILKKLDEDGRRKKSSTTPDKPTQLDLKTLRIENGSVTYRASSKDGSQTSGDLSGLAVTVQNLRNDGKGRVEGAANFKLDERPTGASAKPGSLSGALKGGFDLGLTSDLLPSTLSGKAETQLQQATGTFQEFQGLTTVLAADLTPTELKRLGLDFVRQGTALGSVTARGPLDMAKREGQLQVEISAIDRNVLNLFGAAMGLDFLTSRFDSTNRIEIAAAGQKIGVQGSVAGTKVSVKQGELTLPPVDLKNAYDVTLDLTAQSATVKAFALSANQSGREILRGTLSQPMQVSWAATAGTVPDAGVDFALNDVRLADWSALLGTPLQGSVTAKANVGVKNGGKDLAIDALATLSGVAGTFGSNVVRNLGLNTVAKVSVVSFADATQRRLTSTATIENLTGQAADIQFDRFGAALQADLGLPEGAVAFNDLQVRLRQGSQDGGLVTVKGRWDTRRGAGDLEVVAQGVNDSGLRPFLQAALGDKQLRSIKISANAAVKFDPAGSSAVKATADVKDLVVHDPSGTVPETPLSLGLAIDASGSGGKLTLRQADLQLTPTERARNQIRLSGDLDFAKTNALKGALKLDAASLDLTPYYNLFTSAPKTNAEVSPNQPAPRGPQQEPEPIHLPVELLTADATVGKLFLRELAVSDFVTSVRIEGSRILVEPFQFTLNGAPVKAGVRMNLGVPGYEYDLKLNADRMPVKPFANSFMSALKDRIDGTVNAGLNVKGAGVTGLNLQKHLAGDFNFAVTNANLKLTDSRAQKGILGMLTGILATALNIRELKDQPIMEMGAEAKMGGGKIDLVQAMFRSSSLEAGSKGSIPIAADLMQSPLNLPINLSLKRELAQHARLVGTNTPTNAVYVPIPAIASIKGTLGAPVAEVDKVKTGLLAARGIAGFLGGQTGSTVGQIADLVGGVTQGNTNAVSNLIQGLGGLLGGKSQTGTNSASTNKPGNNPVGELLKSLNEPKKKP